MLFQNEYIMDAKRYAKWTAPKFWCLPIFYIYIVIFSLAAFGLWYFNMVGASSRWKSLCAILMFISVYRGIFFKWMYANKQYRLMRQKYFNDKPWDVKIEIDPDSVSQTLNGKYDGKTAWSCFKILTEAKTSFTLKTEEGNGGIKIDKSSFTKGDTESFKAYCLEKKGLKYEKEKPMFDR